MVAEKVIILDAGSQFSKLIDRRIREFNVLAEIMPLQTSAQLLKKNGCSCIIISGGPTSVYNENSPKLDKDIFNMGLPVLGICYGMQLINQVFGGTVEQAARKDGQFDVSIDKSCPIFKQIDKEVQSVLLTHGDSVIDIAADFKVVGKSDNCVVAIANERHHIYGLQFHPEVDLTPCGKQIFSTFLFKLAGLKGTYTLESREQACIQMIKQVVGNSKVLILVSGGVDSTVVAGLCYKALDSNQVVAIHIDNGLMRKNESESVLKQFQTLGIDVKFVNASLRFYNSTTTLYDKHHKTKERKITSRVLCQTIDPEEKRKIIGDTFMRVVDDEAKSLGLTINECMLAQGTLRPDLIESASEIASTNADAIKTHHNDTELVRILRANGRVLEPLKDFHKDEVRELGRRLGLPESVVMRHPFPGPGLGIRIICADEPYMSSDFSMTQTILRIIASYSHSINKPHALLQKIHAVLTSEESREKLRLYTERFPMKVVLLPIKSVGVQGDGRTYSYVVGVSSSKPNPDWEVLFFLAKTIPRICQNVNRIAYIFDEQVTEPIQDVTPTILSFNCLATLRQCDFVANNVLMKHNAMKSISQMPVILLPLHFDRDTLTREPSCQRSVVLRPFISSDFMTGLAARPGTDISEDIILEMVSEIKKVPGISRVLYDLSDKPPGTTEWE